LSVRARLSSLALLSVVTFLAGCTPPGADDEVSALAAATMPPWQATLTSVTYEQWLEELAALRGRIVVVDFWATWCVPCLERFPHMVQLERRYGPKGVTFVSLSLDDREDAEAIAFARQFLTEQKATFANYLLDEIVTEGFVKLDLLTVPAVFIYDATGKRRFELTGDDPNNQFSDHDVERAIRDLISEAVSS
jgi:thiol-disulfide isomerase/thioredoxin